MPPVRAVAIAVFAIGACERTDHVQPTNVPIQPPAEDVAAIAQEPHPIVAREDDPPPAPAASAVMSNHLTVRDQGLMCMGPNCTPLVVAFEGQPIEFLSTGGTFAFRPGAHVATDWPTAATPWIAIDLDGDGAITSGAELFGDSSVLPDGKRAHHGYEALAALDTNRDGVIDRDDPAFAKLLLWSDRDGDRRSSPGELLPLSSIVISIPLSYRRAMQCDARGNCEGERGAMRWRDEGGVERTGAVVDVYLPRR
jgi:hypothetical protein